MKRQLLIVALLGTLFLCSALAKEENHVGYELIKNLQLESLNIINELDDQWKTQSALLQKGISSWENTVNQQTVLCDTRSTDLSKVNKDIENTEGYIRWITNKIAENEARVQTLLEWRCTANTLYINGIKNNKLTLSLLNYLYKELSTAKNLEMLQKMHVMTKMTVFIEAYKLGNVAALLDAPVFAQFKAHLQNTDGEEDDEFSEEDEEALEEVEDELADEHELEEELGSVGAYHDDEGSDDGENTVPLGAAHEADGEWEDEDEYDEDEEEEFEDDE
jgi:septal ring factor EnvC (AmiA/AmiB activator)